MSVKLRRIPKKKQGQLEKPPMPLPEAIDGSAWDIKEASHRRDGMVELRPEGGGRLTVPLGGGDVERAMRLHEQTHAAITPREPEAWDGVDEVVLQLCEDRRVHHALEVGGMKGPLEAMGELAKDMAIEWDRLKLDYKKANNARDKAGRSLKVMPPRAITAARVMAAYGTGLQDAEYKAAYKLDKEAAKYGFELAGQFSGSEVRPFEEAKMAAELLCDTFGSPGDPIRDDPESPPPPTPLPGMRSMPGMLEELSKLRSEALKPGRHDLDDDYSTAATTKPWPTMQIIEKARPVRMKVTLMGAAPKKIPDVRGRSLRRVSRLAQDGRVFRTKHPVKRYGGAVLIDCSGSMSLSDSQVEAVLGALPAAVIATYCGAGSKGELWVIARDGRRVKPHDLQAEMHGNIIDVPALEWLCKQKGPRYWVSDGWVTEHNDSQTPRVIATCHHLQKQGKIVRVPHPDQVLAHEGWERIR